MALPVLLLAKAAFRVGLRLIPVLRNIVFVVARKGFRKTLQRRMLVNIEYAKRLAKPTLRRATAEKLLKRATRFVVKREKRKLAISIKNKIGVAKEAFNSKQTARQSLKQMVARTTTPTKKFLATNLAIDVFSATTATIKIVKGEKKTVMDTLTERRNALDAKTETVPNRPKTVAQPDKVSTGGLIYVKAHTRNGKRVEGYYRRA